MTRPFFDYWASRLRFLDVHYHARPDSYQRRYSAMEAGERYAQYQGGVVLKNHLGSVSALASAMQEQGLPVFGSVVLNAAAGGINLNVVRQALSQYQFEGAPRLLVHLPTVVPTAHKSGLSRTFSNEYARHFAGQPLPIADEAGELRSGVKTLIHFARHHDIVISSGHATKDQTLRLIEAVERVGGCRLMLNQPANPMTGFTARELRALGEHEWLFVEQCALTVYLGYQPLDDLCEVLTGVHNLVYSSDLGQPGQPDIGEWLEDSHRWFREAGLDAARIEEIALLNPLRMLAPGPLPG
ncbi:DUF6282 family protein [Enterobacter bugandensis]